MRREKASDTCSKCKLDLFLRRCTKMDAVYGDENEIVQSLRQEFEKDGIRVFPISAVSGKGLKELLYHCLLYTSIPISYRS